jgi:hypothetical protein
MYKRNVKATNTDSDLDRRTWARTIGVVLAGVDLHTLSNGEFDVTYLTKYPHRRQLEECCEKAVEELADQPYEGRISCARVMGRAMELLREDYGFDAPRGWVPVLRRLRAVEGGAERQLDKGRRPSYVATKSAAERQPERENEASREKLFRYRPDEILTDWRSPIQELPSGRSFAEFVEGRHDLKRQFIELAKKVGVPRGWWDALSFLEFIADGLDEVPEPFREALAGLRDYFSGNGPQAAGEIQRCIDELRLERSRPVYRGKRQ